MGDLLTWGSACVRTDQGHRVYRVLTNLHGQGGLAVLATTGNCDEGGDLASAVRAYRLAAAYLADDSVGDGDVAGVIAVTLDVDYLAVGAVNEPDEVGLFR